MTLQHEQRIVTTLLFDFTHINMVEDINPQMFTDRDSRIVYTAMLELQVEGEPVDLVSIGKQSGFNNYELSELMDKENPSSALIKYDCAEIVKGWQQREITLALKMGAEGEPGARASEIKAKLDDILGYASSSVKSFPELMEDWRNNYTLWNDDKIHLGLETGYTLLDYMVRYRQGNLITIGARTGGGKTTFALNQAVNIAKAGHKVGIISMEMSTNELIDKLFGITSSINTDTIYSKPEFKRIISQSSRIEKTPLLIEAPLFNDAEKIFNLIRKQANNGAEIVFVDYLQLMFHGGKFQNRNYEIGKITASLKVLASELKIPIVILSQLKRKDANPVPELSDLRDSGSIEQDSNIVIFLHDSDNYQCRVAKNRGGKCGVVEMIFKKDISLIEEASF